MRGDAIYIIQTALEVFGTDDRKKGGDIDLLNLLEKHGIIKSANEWNMPRADCKIKLLNGNNNEVYNQHRKNTTRFFS